MNGVSPTNGALVPAAPTPAPWLKWPPDKKIWAGGVAGIAAYVILGLISHFLGFDIQAIMVSVLGPSAPDLQGMLATLIALAVAHFTTPSLADVVQHVNNDVVAIAAATPDNKTTAEVVPEARSDQVAVANAIAGKLPDDTVKQMVAAGMVSPKAVLGGKLT